MNAVRAGPTVGTTHVISIDRQSAVALMTTVVLRSAHAGGMVD